MYFGIRQYQLYLDLPGLALLLAGVVGFTVAAVTFNRRKVHLAICLTIAVLASSAVLAYRGVMAPEQSWLAMLGSIESASGPERELRIGEFRTRWQRQTMRALDWYLLANRWGVCHSLWRQHDCVKPASSQQAVGVAREVLNELATSTAGAL